MSSRKYVFAQHDDDVTPEGYMLEPIKFYQICGFPHPVKQKYEIRIVHIDGNDHVASMDLYNVSKATQKKIRTQLRDNLYRIYATFTLDGTPLPTLNDISVARSRMICDDSTYSGFARF